MTHDRQSDAVQWTILKTLQWTARYFKDKGIDQGRSSAEILLAHVLGCERIDLYLRHDQPLNRDELGRFRSLIQRRTRREPVAYITGHREFWSLDMVVTPEVLIPRPETERLVEIVLEHSAGRSGLNVLELGVGSGAVSIALAVERPGWAICATDASSKALAVARRNAARHGCADTIRFLAGNWFDPIDSQRPRFDLIVSNPPYIARADLPALQPDVGRFEPALALDGGADGMQWIEHLIDSAPPYLKPGGQLFIEVGFDQGPAAERFGRQCGAFEQATVYKDYARQDRVLRLVKLAP